mmetsp:Transcript_49175/g.107032  ORF Transcript_49175/g.107032 Transcript_49175/m.107032 type:complete len:209 (-) Transcript_49175:577-1203(-)
MVQKGHWLAKIKSPNSIEQKILRIVARPWSAAHFVKLHFDQLGQSPQICAASCVDVVTNNRTEYKAWPNSAARKSMTLSVEQTVHSVGFLWCAAAPNLQLQQHSISVEVEVNRDAHLHQDGSRQRQPPAMLELRTTWLKYTVEDTFLNHRGNVLCEHIVVLWPQASQLQAGREFSNSISVKDNGTDHGSVLFRSDKHPGIHVGVTNAG